MLHAMRWNAWDDATRFSEWETRSWNLGKKVGAPKAACGRRNHGRPALADIVVGYFWAVLQWAHGHRSVACPLQYHAASLAQVFP